MTLSNCTQAMNKIRFDVSKRYVDMKIVITISTFTEILKGKRPFIEVLQEKKQAGFTFLAPTQLREEMETIWSNIAKTSYLTRKIFDERLQRYLTYITLVDLEQYALTLPQVVGKVSAVRDEPYLAVGLASSADGLWDESETFFTGEASLRQYKQAELEGLPSKKVQVLYVGKQVAQTQASIPPPIPPDFHGPITPGFNLQYVRTLLKEQFTVFPSQEKEDLPNPASVKQITEFAITRIIEDEKFAIVTTINMKNNRLPLKGYDELFIEWNSKVEDYGRGDAWDLDTEKNIFIYWGETPEFLSEDPYNERVQKV